MSKTSPAALWCFLVSEPPGVASGSTSETCVRRRRAGTPSACTFPKSSLCPLPKALPPFPRWAGGPSPSLSIALGPIVISTCQQQCLTYITLKNVLLKHSCFPSSQAKFRQCISDLQQTDFRKPRYLVHWAAQTNVRQDRSRAPACFLAPEGLLRASCQWAPTSNPKPWRNSGHEGAPKWPGCFFNDVLVIGQFDTSQKTKHFRMN